MLSQVKNKPYYIWALTLLGGLLLWLGWPVKPLPFLLFIALVPLLVIEDHLSRDPGTKVGRKFFLHTYLIFLVWNLGTTWWVVYATAAGAIFMLLANAFLMSIPLVMFRLTKKAAGASWGYFSLVLYWMSFEYIHLSWDLSWPWLTLGNGFAVFPEWIQWYEYTGVFGGTLWIWLVNLLLFFAFFKKRNNADSQVAKPFLVYALLLIVLPIAISYYIYYAYEETGQDIEVVVMQPNIDPYTEKFIDTENFIPFDQQLERFFQLSAKEISPSTAFLVWPETAIDYQFREERINDYPLFNRIEQFKDQYPDLSLLSGLVSYTVYENKESSLPSSRYDSQIGYFDMFNAAMFLSDDHVSFYHKSKLVPGVEVMPYPQVFGFISELLFDLGGTSGGYGRQKEKTVFYNEEGVGVAPSICYESIYGDYMRQFVLNGANLIFIITNDGWWWKSEGYKQHLHYATLRAVETRRSIARSANTGVSCFINQRGDILQPTDFWVQDVIKGTIKSNDKITFYTQYGDYLARTACWLSILVFLAAFVKKRMGH